MQTVAFRPSPAVSAWLATVPTEHWECEINGALALARTVTTEAAAHDRYSAQTAEGFDRIAGLITQALPAAGASKGGAAERSLDEYIVEAFPSWQLDECSAEKRRGDRVLRQGQHSVLLEVKDYSGTVPSREVDKFERDLRSNSSQVGVFLVLESNIARKPHGRISLQRVDDKLAVYVPQCSRDGWRAIAALEFATWLCVQCTNPATANTMAQCLDEVDGLYRELGAIADRLNADVVKLNEVRVGALVKLRARLARG